MFAINALAVSILHQILPGNRDILTYHIWRNLIRFHIGCDVIFWSDCVPRLINFYIFSQWFMHTSAHLMWYYALEFTLLQCWLQLVVFHLKVDFLSNFVLILIILNLSLWVLYYTVKLWNVHFWVTLGCSFTCYKRKFTLLKSSLWICHLKMIKMYWKLDRKSPFTSAATWWSSTLESGEWVVCPLSID